MLLAIAAMLVQHSESAGAACRGRHVVTGWFMSQLMEVHGDYSAEVAPDVGTAIERPAEEGEEAAPAEEGADWS